MSEVRIIGGTLRSRKIYFPDVSVLRPTPNRIRETLFNWLAPYIQGAYCLDLFAGSGALGFEAVSRGATHCLMLDSSPEIIKALLENKTKLQVSNIDIIQASFPYSSAILKHRFDIVFLDPPFHQGYIPKALSWLEGTEILNIAALVYIESENEGELTLPPGWEFFRDKTSGNVRYSLIRPSIL